MRKRFNRLIPVLSAVIMLAGGVAFTPVAIAQSAAASKPTAAETSLLNAEDQRFDAQIRRDVAVIGRLMADEVVYTHAVGRVQTKADYLRGIETGRAPYRSIVASDRTVRVSGEMGMTHGVLKMLVGENNLESSYLAVYVMRDRRWQLLFWQTSPAPPAAPAPASAPALTPGR